MYFIFILLSLCVSAFATDSQVDLRLDLDPLNPRQKTSFNVITTSSVLLKEEKVALLLTPEMSFYADGAIDFSVTGTHRYRLEKFVFGHNVFLDRTNVGQFYLQQLGTGVDILTKRFDIRANYYHPISYRKRAFVRTCKWIDSEIFFKTKHFAVGTGPMYNFDEDVWALHSRLIIPFKDFSLNLGALCGATGYSQAIFSVSFHLFKPARLSNMTSPPSHVQKANIYYNTGYAYEQASLEDRFAGKFRSQEDPNVENYIDQTEEEIVLREKD